MLHFSLVSGFGLALIQVWSHIDGGSCPGQGIGARTRLDNGISGFLHIKNISDGNISSVEDRVQVNELLQAFFHHSTVDPL